MQKSIGYLTYALFVMMVVLLQTPSEASEPVLCDVAIDGQMIASLVCDGNDVTPLQQVWQWVCDTPSLPLWIVLALLLIIPKSNRNWRDWLAMLTYPVLVIAVWWSIGLIFGIAGDEQFGITLFSLHHVGNRMDRGLEPR